MQVRYVEAQQIAFPFATAKVAGPFETFAEIAAAMDRLRPLYPDCSLRPRSENVSVKQAALALGGPKIVERTK